jgi:hypothetical protein
MVVLGIVLIVLAVALGLGVLVSSTESTMLEIFGIDFGVRVPTIFFLGAAVGAAFVAGLWLTKKGLGRSYRRRKEIKELRQQVEGRPAGSVAPEDRAPRPTTGTPPDSGTPRTNSSANPGTHNSTGTAERLGTDPFTVAEGTEISPTSRWRSPST